MLGVLYIIGVAVAFILTFIVMIIEESIDNDDVLETMLSIIMLLVLAASVSALSWIMVLIVLIYKLVNRKKR